MNPFKGFFGKQPPQEDAIDAFKMVKRLLRLEQGQELSLRVGSSEKVWRRVK